MFKSAYNEASESVRLMYLLSIASAAKSVRIANAYFVPDDLAVATMVAARRRGVQVEIIVPGHHTDAKVVRRASRSAPPTSTTARFASTTRPTSTFLTRNSPAARHGSSRKTRRGPPSLPWSGGETVPGISVRQSGSRGSYGCSCSEGSGTRNQAPGTRTG